MAFDINLEKEVAIKSKKGIIIDSKPLFLLLTGKLGKNYIGTLRPVKDYGEEDYDILAAFLSKFGKFIITPHILTEISNWATKVGKKIYPNFLEKLIQIVKEFEEFYISKGDLFENIEFKNVGVTDTSTIMLCNQNDYVMLTTDKKLFEICIRNGITAIHFDQLRGYNYTYGK